MTLAVEMLAGDPQAAEREVRWGVETLEALGERNAFSTIAVVRPEVVRLGVAGDGMRGVVSDVTFRGSGLACQIDVEGLADPVKAELSGASRSPPELGSTVGISSDSAAVCLLSHELE
jgi:TOBE domain